MLDLALPDQLLDRAGDVFHWHSQIDSMLVEQVDAVGLEPLERRFGDGPDALRPAIAGLAGVPILETKLGGNNDLFTKRFQGFTYDFLICIRPIYLCSIKKCNTFLISCTYEFYSFLFVGGRTISKA